MRILWPTTFAVSFVFFRTPTKLKPMANSDERTPAYNKKYIVLGATDECKNVPKVQRTTLKRGRANTIKRAPTERESVSMRRVAACCRIITSGNAVTQHRWNSKKQTVIWWRLTIKMNEWVGLAWVVKRGYAMGLNELSVRWVFLSGQGMCPMTAGNGRQLINSNPKCVRRIYCKTFLAPGTKSDKWPRTQAICKFPHPPRHRTHTFATNWPTAQLTKKMYIKFMLLFGHCMFYALQFVAVVARFLIYNISR